MRIRILSASLLALTVLFAATLTTRPVQAFEKIAASVSPDGATSAVWTKDHEILLVDSNGSAMRKIGVHGAAPVFSHDGRFIAYEKLADVSPDGSEQGLYEFAQGIAVYDLQTSQEFLATHGGGDDYAPAGFSKDLNQLYFNSTRPYPDSPGNHVASLWVVNLKTSETRRLTNVDERVARGGGMVPTISPNALWSSDRTMVITSYGPETGVWKFLLNNGNVPAERIADGDAPQWAERDASVVVRTVVNGKTASRIIKVR